MRVLINAVSIKDGGSLVVLVRLLAAMMARNPGIEWLVVVHPAIARELPQHERVQALVFDWAERTPLHLLYWYNRTLPLLVRRLQPDVVFSQTNYLPDCPMSCPTLLLEQHAGHFSPIFKRLMESSLRGWPALLAWRSKTWWVHRSVRSANLLTVQTKALADAISLHAKVASERIRVIPHGTGLLEPVGTPRPWPGERPWRIGYITKPGVQKNFDVLFRALQRMRSAGRSFKLVLTLDKSDLQYLSLEAKMSSLGILNCVENYGNLHQEQVAKVYETLDLFVFPSLCESFGFPLLEAMSMGIPLLVADTPGNREVAASAALVFRGFDPDDLMEQIKSLMDDPPRYRSCAAAALTRSRDFSWDKAADATLFALNLLATGK